MIDMNSKQIIEKNLIEEYLQHAKNTINQKLSKYYLDVFGGFGLTFQKDFEEYIKKIIKLKAVKFNSVDEIQVWFRNSEQKVVNEINKLLRRNKELDSWVFNILEVNDYKNIKNSAILEKVESYYKSINEGNEISKNDFIRDIFLIRMDENNLTQDAPHQESYEEKLTEKNIIKQLKKVYKNHAGFLTPGYIKVFGFFSDKKLSDIEKELTKRSKREGSHASLVALNFLRELNKENDFKILVHEKFMSLKQRVSELDINISLNPLNIKISKFEKNKNNTDVAMALIEEIIEYNLLLDKANNEYKVTNSKSKELKVSGDLILSDEEKLIFVKKSLEKYTKINKGALSEQQLDSIYVKLAEYIQNNTKSDLSELFTYLSNKACSFIENELKVRVLRQKYMDKLNLPEGHRIIISHFGYETDRVNRLKPYDSDMEKLVRNAGKEEEPKPCDETEQTVIPFEGKTQDLVLTQYNHSNLGPAYTVADFTNIIFKDVEMRSAFIEYLNEGGSLNRFQQIFFPLNSKDIKDKLRNGKDGGAAKKVYNKLFTSPSIHKEDLGFDEKTIILTISLEYARSLANKCDYKVNFFNYGTEYLKMLIHSKDINGLIGNLSFIASQEKYKDQAIICKDILKRFINFKNTNSNLVVFQEKAVNPTIAARA